MFPVWGDYAGPRGYSQDMGKVQVAELDGGAAVAQLQLANLGNRPVLVLEGQLLEGGWQHRMVARSTLVAAAARQGIDVMCVEQGRWDGDRLHETAGRRASYRVRDGLRHGDAQGEVWRRVSSYDGLVGANPTDSFARHLDRVEDDVESLVRGLRPLPGQMGVLVGIAGQPVSVEVFDSPYVLRRQFGSIVRAAAMDALGKPAVPTPSRRARRFVDRVAAVSCAPTLPAGLGISMEGTSQYAAVRGLAWQGRQVHLVGTNVRHELVAA